MFPVPANWPNVPDFVENVLYKYFNDDIRNRFRPLYVRMLTLLLLLDLTYFCRPFSMSSQVATKWIVSFAVLSMCPSSNHSKIRRNAYLISKLSFPPARCLLGRGHTKWMRSGLFTCLTLLSSATHCYDQCTSTMQPPWLWLAILSSW